VWDFLYSDLVVSILLVFSLNILRDILAMRLESQIPESSLILGVASRNRKTAISLNQMWQRFLPFCKKLHPAQMTL